MKKKQEWMKKGGPCLAAGKKATIMKFQENTGLGTVYYFWVRFDGDKRTIGPYHPADIEELPQ